MMAHLCLSVYDHLQNAVDLPAEISFLSMLAGIPPGKRTILSAPAAMKGEERWANSSPSRQQFVQNLKGYSKGVKAPWKFGMSCQGFSDGPNIARERAARTVTSFS